MQHRTPYGPTVRKCEKPTGNMGGLFFVARCGLCFSLQTVIHFISFHFIIHLSFITRTHARTHTHTRHARVNTKITENKQEKLSSPLDTTYLPTYTRTL